MSRAIGLISSITASEREFYDFVCHSFRELQTTTHPAGTSPSLFYASANMRAALG